MTEFLTTPVPHSEGADFLRNKPAVTRAIFDALAPELQAKAFVITGVESLEVVARVRELIARLPEGGDFDELKGQIQDELSPWLVTSTDPAEREKQMGEARRRAELLLRMHGWQAYARTNHAMIMANIDVFPYCEYIDSGDGRVRETHHALNGKILPTDHPFWLTHTPPWEFGCRCDKVGRMQEEVDEMREAETHLPMEERRVLDEDQLRRLEQDGQLFTRTKKGFLGWLDVRTPRERNGGDGYEWRVDQDPLSIDTILQRFTDPERKAFEDFAGRQKLDDGRTLLDWWKNGRALTPVNVPANIPSLPPATPATTPGPAPAAPIPAAPVSQPSPARKPKLPKNPVDRMRVKIATANYKTDTPLGGGVNTTVRVKNSVEVVFKPVSGERNGMRTDVPARTQFLREKAASIIDQHLRTDLVPPTEIIMRNGEVGSAQLFSKGAKTYHDAKRRGPVVLNPETQRRMQLLDDVLGHLDRHAGNWMVMRKRGAAEDVVLMIDNGLSMSEHPLSSGTRFRGPLHGKPLDAVSLQQIDDFLARRAEWEPLLLNLVSQVSIDLMIRRIQHLKSNGFGIIAQRL